MENAVENVSHLVELTSIGLGFIVLGIALGIGIIGKAAMDAIGRQPEASSKIQTAMIIAAALIEGAGLFAIVISYLLGS
jgi:F-type H+-transporting ATPase subunit c